MTIKAIQKAQTTEDLNNLKIGNVIYEINGRTGYVGFYNIDIAQHFKLNHNMLPNKFGAYYNYLGGGIRGCLQLSSFNTAISLKIASKLILISEACKRVLINLENEAGMNDELDENNDTNWEAMGTNAARQARVKSAY